MKKDTGQYIDSFISVCTHVLEDLEKESYHLHPFKAHVEHEQATAHYKVFLSMLHTLREVHDAESM